ncbi:MAG: GNAT family N-acetyltransferase [Candidatus Bathyarchaeia archaeon]
MDVEIRRITEANLEDEVRICVPQKDSPDYHKFERGIQEKIEWLQQRVKDYGCVGNIAYNPQGEPLGFVEFVPAEGAPIPIEDTTYTALITCIYLPKMQGRGIGTGLLRAALKQLSKIGARHVKALVSRSQEWINDGIYRKHGFQLEKTFYQTGKPEPLDLLTLSLHDPQPRVEPMIVHLKAKTEDTSPIEVVYFHSAQCPFSSALAKSHSKLSTPGNNQNWRDDTEACTPTPSSTAEPPS